MENQMRASNLLLAAAAVLMTSSTIASAQSSGSMYFGGHAGLNLTADSDTTEPFLFYGDTTTFGAGGAVGGFVGYDTGTGVRAEGELTYRSNSHDEFSNISGGDLYDGGFDSLSLMVSAYYDFDMGSQWTPYLGGGIGVAFMSSDIEVVGLPVIDDEDTVFAYQLGAGIGYEVSSNMTITLDYRYFATDNPVFTDSGLDDIEFEYFNHSILVGVRVPF